MLIKALLGKPSRLMPAIQKYLPKRDKAKMIPYLDAGLR
jgi:hypothetical protein